MTRNILKKINRTKKFNYEGVTIIKDACGVSSASFSLNPIYRLCLKSTD